jgi:hypothetical protein
LAPELAWHDVRGWGIEGKGFADTQAYFDRLPARAKGVVRDIVWNLSRHASGMSARFETDATDIHVRYALLNPELAMAHMPATGVSGVDLYARHNDAWRCVATHQPKQRETGGVLGERLLPGRRLYQLNLPLYNGVTRLEIGVPKGTAFAPVAPRKDKPILFYGTSITHGACASRPGMAFVNILGRRLDRPVLNFGFSGSGKTELEVARFLAELDPAVFVLDCVANTTAEEIADRTGPVVKLWRDRHPSTPILLVEDRTWDYAPLVPHLMETHHEKRAALRRAYDELLAGGVSNIHYRAGDDLSGSDGDATVDGSHPSDLGMTRYANALEPVLRRLPGV